jgi:hypothetical protein
MPEPAKKRPAKAAPPPQDEARDDRATPTCNVGFCPICLAVTSLQPLRPDVIEHLLVAGREFLLAAKAILETRGGQVSGEEGTGHRDSAGRARGLEKIDIG